MNSQTHGLCSQAALLPSEDPIVYQLSSKASLHNGLPQQIRKTVSPKSSVQQNGDSVGFRVWKPASTPSGSSKINLFLDEPDSIKRDRNVQSKLYSSTKSNSKTCLCKSAASAVSTRPTSQS